MTALSLLAPLVLFGLLLALARLETRQFGPPTARTGNGARRTAAARSIPVDIDRELLNRLSAVMGHTRSVEETVDAALRGFIVERNHPAPSSAPAKPRRRFRTLRARPHASQRPAQTITRSHGGTAGADVATSGHTSTRGSR